MSTEIVIEVEGIVGCESLETGDGGGEFIEFGEATSAFLFDADFDFADPSSLHFDALRDDLLFQPGGDVISTVNQRDVFALTVD